MNIVVVADDHALLRGLTQTLKLVWPDAKTREANSLETAIELLRAETAQLLILDLSMPGITMPDGLKAVRSASATVPMIVLTASDDPTTTLQPLTYGVNDFVTKSTLVNTILEAVQRVLSGEVVAVGTSTYDPVMESVPKPADGPKLSRRQLEVLQCLCDGLATKEISRRLNLGEGTVKIHLAGLYRSLRVRNRVEAVLRAHKLRLVDPQMRPSVAAASRRPL